MVLRLQRYLPWCNIAKGREGRRDCCSWNQLWPGLSSVRSSWWALARILCVYVLTEQTRQLSPISCSALIVY